MNSKGFSLSLLLFTSVVSSVFLIKICPAFACSCRRIQNWGFVHGDSVIPHDSQGLLWWGDFSGKEPSPVSLTDELGKPLELVYQQFFKENQYQPLWLFRPKQGFQPGRVYTFLTNQTKQDSHVEIPRAHITVSEKNISGWRKEIPLKQKVVPKEALLYQDWGMCHEPLSAVQLQIEMDFPEALAPFKEHFFYETFVDGQPWIGPWSACNVRAPGSSKIGKGKDILYGSCLLPNGDQTSGLSPGSHTVRIEASLPGAFVWISSASIEVNLPCVFNL